MDSKDLDAHIEAMMSARYKKGWSGQIDFCIDTKLPIVNILSAKDKHSRWGIPSGSLIAIYGNPKVGKTGFILRIIGGAMAMEGLNPHIWLQETEGGLITPSYMEQNGVVVEEVWEDFPKNLQDAFSPVIEKLYELSVMYEKKNIPRDERQPFIIVLDSISAIGPKTELESIIAGKEQAIATHSRVTSAALRNLTGLLRETRSIMVVTAHRKEDLGWGKQGAGTHISAKPVWFHAALVFEVKKKKDIKKGSRVIGFDCDIVLKHSKLGPPKRKAEDLKLYYGKGFDYRSAVNAALLETNICKKTGGKFKINPKLVERLGVEEYEDIEELEDKKIEEMVELVYQVAKM